MIQRRDDAVQQLTGIPRSRIMDANYKNGSIYMHGQSHNAGDGHTRFSTKLAVKMASFDSTGIEPVTANLACKVS